MTNEERYKKICDTLGYEPRDVAKHYQFSETEDDSKKNPFHKLSADDCMFLLENGYLESA